jgi:hypothetical protein
MSKAEALDERRSLDASRARFEEVVLALVGKPGVTPPTADAESGQRFGSNALKANGKIFAMQVREKLVVKLPKARVEALCASDDGQRWDPGHGRLMKEWLALEPTSDVDWLLLATEAMEFVSRKR